MSRRKSRSRQRDRNRHMQMKGGFCLHRTLCQRPRNMEMGGRGGCSLLTPPCPLCSQNWGSAIFSSNLSSRPVSKSVCPLCAKPRPAALLVRKYALVSDFSPSLHCQHLCFPSDLTAGISKLFLEKPREQVIKACGLGRGLWHNHSILFFVAQKQSQTIHR